MAKEKKLKDLKNNITHNDYKFDDSAAKAGRQQIGNREVGVKVDPKHMTRKEYVHYLCHLFDFKIGTAWDGVEQNKYQQNWTAEKSHNVKTREEALAFLGVEPLPKAPDGIEKRRKQRRNGTKDTRVIKLNRRIEKKRRKEDLLNSLTYFVTVWLLLLVMVSWGAYSVYLHIEGLK